MVLTNLNFVKWFACTHSPWIFRGYKSLITDQLSFYMANEHRRIYFTNMISNCNVAHVNELYLKNDLNQIVRQEIQKRLDNCGVKRLRLRDYLQNSVLATRKNIQSIDRSKSRATDHVYSDETIFSLSHSSRSSICCLV